MDSEDDSEVPRRRQRTTSSNNSQSERSSARVSLTMKWEDFFGSSLDLTSSVVNSLDTLGSVDTIKEEDIQSGFPSPSPFVASTTAENVEESFDPLGEDFSDLDPTACVPESISNSVVSGSVVDIKSKRPLSLSSTSSSSTSSLPRQNRQVMKAKKASVSVITSTPATAILPSSCGTLDSAYHSEDSNPPACGVEGVPARVIEEVVDTERTYLRDLMVIQKGYIDPVAADDRFTPAAVEVVFSNLPALCSFHKLFLERIESSLHKELSAFSSCFTEAAVQFESLYIDYCTNFPTSLVRLEELLGQPEAAEFFSTCQSKMQLMLPLHTYLLKPVQRILKYHLLLESLYKSLKPIDDGALARRIAPAVDAMTTVAAHINEVQRRHEHALRVRELASLIKAARLNLADLGELVLEDTFQLAGRKGERQVFLFSQAIVITKRQQTSGYLVFKDIIKCVNLMLIESIPEQPMSFHVLPYDNPKSQHTLQGRTIDQKRSWCQEIKRLILENYQQKIPEKAKQIVMNMNELIAAGSTGSGGSTLPATSTHGSDEIDSKARRKSATAPLPHGSGQSPSKLSRRPSEPSPSTDRNLGFTATMAMVEELPPMKIGGDLHEEVWKEWLARYAAFDSSSTSSEEEEEEPAGPSLPEDADFRCIAVEINEERMMSSSGVRHRHHHRPVQDHRRQPSTGRASELLRHTIDTAFGVNASASNGTSHGPSMSVDEKSPGGNGKNSVPLYIHCPPAGSYSNVSFGRAYEQYILKTKNKIMLSPTDIDEIFRPLSLGLKTSPAEEKGSTEEKEENQPLSMLEEVLVEESRSPCSSGGSSPRHIVSRIATHSMQECGASLDSARVVNWSMNEQDPSAEETQSGGWSLMNGLRSKLGKSSSNGSIKRSESIGESASSSSDLCSIGGENGKGDASQQSERRGSIVQRFMRAYGRGSKRDKKSNDDPSVSTPLPPVSAPNSPVPTTNQRNLRHLTSEIPKPVVNAKSTLQHSPRKKGRAPPIPVSVGLKDSGEHIQSQAPQHSRCASAPVASPEKDEESVQMVCHGRVRAAMNHLMDSLPYADDSDQQGESHVTGSTAPKVRGAGPNRGQSAEWQGDNRYWKRALLQEERPQSPQNYVTDFSIGTGVKGTSIPAVSKIRSNSSSGLSNRGTSHLSTSASLRVRPTARTPLFPTNSSESAVSRSSRFAPPSSIASATLGRRDTTNNNNDGTGASGSTEEEAEPPRGLVRNMVSRFQKPT